MVLYLFYLFIIHIYIYYYTYMHYDVWPVYFFFCCCCIFFIKKLIHTYAEPFCRRRRSDTKGIYYFSLNHYFPVLYIWISIYLYLIR